MHGSLLRGLRARAAHACCGMWNHARETPLALASGFGRGNAVFVEFRVAAGPGDPILGPSDTAGEKPNLKAPSCELGSSGLPDRLEPNFVQTVYLIWCLQDVNKPIRPQLGLLKPERARRLYEILNGSFPTTRRGLSFSLCLVRLQ